MVEKHLNKMFKYDQISREYLHSTSGAPPISGQVTLSYDDQLSRAADSVHSLYAAGCTGGNISWKVDRQVEVVKKQCTKYRSNARTTARLH
jgi:hypothetical protein